MKDILSEAMFDVEHANLLLSTDEEKALSDSEERIEGEVKSTAKAIFDSGAKIVLLCGFSASGKTTFTKKVCEELSSLGREARHIALDDFLLGMGYMPLNSDGTYDMESIEGLDTALANECFRRLLDEGWADFPTFDFPHQRRGERWNRIELGEKGLIIIEGIHALNPLLTENLPEEGIMRIFVEPEKAYFRGGKMILSPAEVRLMRRMTRDELFRGWSTEKTLVQWKSVLEGEKIYIEPYIDSADIHIDSSIETEPSVFVKTLTEMLGKIGEDSPFFGIAKGFCGKLSEFYEADAKKLPKDSILREFLG
ncbi:MAG: hypothetical protein IKL57_02985 [Oscillospiraceae bacterium]|nr:hypothetical protein [Oscillospiraceae bacterium]